MSTTGLHPLSRILPSRPEGPMRAPARALGWFSIGLGLAEIVMPRRVARTAGMPNLPTLTRAYGLREIATGVGILTSKDPSPWLWGRVAGDALDVATVGSGLLAGRRPTRVAASIALLLGIAWLDLQVARKASPAAKRSRSSTFDYSDRSGFPKSVAAVRGVAAPWHRAGTNGAGQPQSFGS